MESLAKQNLEKRLQMVEAAIGMVAYDRLKAQKQIEIAEGNIKLCDLRITKLEAEQTIIQASINDINVDIANVDQATDLAAKEAESLTTQLKKARKRKS